MLIVNLSKKIKSIPGYSPDNKKDKIFAEVNSLIFEFDTLKEILEEAASICLKYFECDRVIIYNIKNDKKAESEILAEQSKAGTQNIKQSRAGSDYSEFFAKIKNRNKAIIITDVFAEPLLYGKQNQLKDSDIKSMLVLKIESWLDSQVILCLQNLKNINELENEDIEIIEDVSRQIEKVISKANLFSSFDSEKDAFITKTSELSAKLKENAKLIEVQKKFISMLSHELRTPLSIILNCAELIEIKNSENNFTEKIKRSVKRVTLLLDTAISLNKIEDGKLKPLKQNYSVKEIINEVMNKFHSNRLVLEESADISIFADRNFCAQAIICVISNSLRYSPEESQIEIGVLKNKNFCEVKIKDYGSGINFEEEAKLFEKFYRGENSSGLPGIGMGFYIAKILLETIGSKIEISKSQNEENEFKISIPLAS